MQKHIKIILILFYFSFVLSCTTAPVCITSSNTPLNGKTVSENLGKVEGTGNSSFGLFWLWSFGKPDIQTAIDDALAKKGADALINIKCYEVTYNFLLFSLSSVRVEGEAVKLKKSESYAFPY